MVLNTAGIVLAGGRSSRLPPDKTQLRLGKMTLLEHVVSRLAYVVDEVIVVARGETSLGSVAQYGCPIRCVEDLVPGRSALIGLYSGLKQSRYRANVVVAADMPFLNPFLIRYMIGLLDGADIVVPRVGKFYEPLHAVYSKDCIPAIRLSIAAGDMRVRGFYPGVRVREVTEQEIKKFDANLHSFFNVNTTEDWQQAQRIARFEAEDSGSRGPAGNLLQCSTERGPLRRF